MLTKSFDLDFLTSVIFIDPPYKYLFFERILNNLEKSKIIAKNTIIVIESDKKNILEFSSNFKIINNKTYGKTKLYFLKKL